MRRLIIAVVLCLLLGMLTSVAVAWIASIQHDGQWNRGSKYADEHWTGYVQISPTTTAIDLERRVVNAKSQSVQYRRSGSQGDVSLPLWAQRGLAVPDDMVNVRMLAGGWPWRCLCYQRVRQTIGFADQWDFQTEWAIAGGNPIGLVRKNLKPHAVYLPIRPIPAALVADTLVLGMPWMLLLYVSGRWRFIRSHYRRVRQRCSQCGYDLRASAGTCPECGDNPARPRPIVSRRTIIALITICLFSMSVIVTAAFLTRLYDPHARILRAAYRGDLERLEQELQSGEQPNVLHFIMIEKQSAPELRILSPLQAAIYGGQHDAVRILLDQGADPDLAVSASVTPLVIALACQHPAIARELIERGADVCPDEGRCMSVLCDVVNTGNAEIVDLLVERGAGVLDNDCLFTWVVYYSPPGAAATIARLLEHGAIVPPDAVYQAVWFGRFEILKLFVEHDPALLDGPFERPLLVQAVENDVSPDIIEFLIERGVDINAAAQGGDTPLIVAARRLRINQVELLLRNGADPNLTDNLGYDALFWAKDANDQKIIDMLLAAGAKPKDSEQ